VHSPEVITLVEHGFCPFIINNFDCFSREQSPEVVLCSGSFLIDYILLHSAAHLRHASAHFLQCSMCECFSHSTAHALQISAQSLQICFTNSLPLAIASIAKRQMAAQSWSNFMQWTHILISCSLKHAVAQLLHSTAHSEHAVIQLWNL